MRQHRGAFSGHSRHHLLMTGDEAADAIPRSALHRPLVTLDLVRRGYPALPDQVRGDRSADPFGQGDDELFRSAYIGHAPDVLVLAHSTDQRVAVIGESIDVPVEVVDFEGHAA